MSEDLIAKHNWEEHKKRYLEEYPELTLAAYAALFGLNPSTTRRAMRGVKSAVKGNVAQQSKSQQQSDHSTGNDHLPSDRPAEDLCASLTTKKNIKKNRIKKIQEKSSPERRGAYTQERSPAYSNPLSRKYRK
ncbi:MAG: hypothetical protein RR721_12700 [Aeromonas sp.]|uniref:hypothetical protein n=1 Tax=Aeromonas sp. TaxID=647 RepID=UPI002FCB6790